MKQSPKKENLAQDGRSHKLTIEGRQPCGNVSEATKPTPHQMGLRFQINENRVLLFPPTNKLYIVGFSWEDGPPNLKY